MKENSPYDSETKEKVIYLESVNQENDLGKNESQSADLKLTANNENSVQGKENCNIKLNKDLTDNSDTRENDLSDGEASSGFETVSSVDYNVDLDDVIDLNDPFDEGDLNVVVQVENEIGRRTFYWKDKNKTSDRNSNGNGASSNDYNSRRHDSFKTSNKEKFWQNRNNEKIYKYGKTEKKSSERDFTKKLGSRDSDHSRNNIHCARDRNKRTDHGHRSRDIKNSEWNHRSRSSRSLERNNRVTSPGCKDRKTEARHSGSFDRNTKSNLKRNSLPRKRRSSYSKSPPSVWKRLDNKIPPGRISNEKKSAMNSSRKKERTPFLVELERKLKEADRMKNLINESKNGSVAVKEVPVNFNDRQPVPELPTEVNQNVAPSNMPMYVAPTPTYVAPTPTYVAPTPNIPQVGFPLQFPPLPTLSVNNLPLVPGPSGLPVHITVTGEQILHDMDGRPIPVGPNGYYLPLDPTGRLFPHIVSPENQAVPIHMTDDGVLRLPNSAPVPYGPSHQLPVNIDGRIILIGPDSKPLYPCLNLPIQPPPYLLNMLRFLGTGNPEQEKIITGASQAENTEVIATELQQGPNNSTDYFEQPEKIPALEVQNLPVNIDVVKKYKKSVQKRCNKIIKSIKIHDNIYSSKRGGPKFCQKKNFKKENKSRGINVNLDFRKSDSKKGSVQEISLSSDEEQVNLKTICDKSSSKEVNTNKETNLIVKKVKHAIKSLCEKNYKPPLLGRLTISKLEESVGRKFSDESPLLRNPPTLPFLDPHAESPAEKDDRPKKSIVTFKFLPQEKPIKEEKGSNVEPGKTQNENLKTEKLPVFTFDFAMQCDFTTRVIKNLLAKITKLESEVFRLRHVNANLLDGYRNVQSMNQKKGDELRKAILEIKERNSEIQSLKHSA